MQSIRRFVDEIEKDQFKCKEKGNLSQSDYSENCVHSFLIQGVQVLNHVQYQKGCRVHHSINHQNPMQPAPWNDA